MNDEHIDYQIRETFSSYAGCVGKRIWSVIRHGTRTPGRKTNALILSRLIEIRDAIVNNYNSSGEY